MRSSNKRSRSKSNRPKTLGNIVNRVFDSSGPEGKVRGTPQQIIEKYQVLARDAQLSNDRVAAENFQQHAEHYTRMLAQAQREMQAEQDARRQHQDDRSRNQPDERRYTPDERGQTERGQTERGQTERGQTERPQNDRSQNGGRRPDQRSDADTRHPSGDGLRDTRTQDNFSVQDFSDPGAGSADLVETPESASADTPNPVPRSEKPEDAPAKPRPANRRKPREPKAQTPAGDGSADLVSGDADTAAKPVRRAPRKPRKPSPDAAETPSSSAAE